MKLFYIISITIGFGVDIIVSARTIMSLIKQKNITSQNFNPLIIFVLPAWGISGLMIFGKQPEEMMKTWNSFLFVLTIAFGIHVFISILLPILVAIICNFCRGRALLDMSLFEES